MRPLVIEPRHKVIKPSLLLEHIGCRWFRGFFLQRQMHPLVPPVLLRVPWLNPFQLNAEAEPSACIPDTLGAV